MIFPKICSTLMVFLISVFPFNYDAWSTEASVNGQRELPRFASLRSSEINVRRGPGRQYPSDWIYTCAGLPIKIIAEYGTWRKIADHEGAGGWVHQAMLSGRRSIIVIVESAKLYNSADSDDSQPIAYIEKNVVCRIFQCKSQRCKITVESYKGWIDKINIWGIKTDEEKFK